MCTLLRKDKLTHIKKRTLTNLVGVFIFSKKMIKYYDDTGILVGMIVNMGLIILGSLIPIPEYFDPMNAINWKPTNFILPFLAHTLGILVGAF